MRYLFVNLYYWGTPDSWVLIDVGLPGCTAAIIKAAERRFGKNTKPKAIVLTHGHFDHVGAFPKLLDHWDVPVYAHSRELPYLTGQLSYEPPDPSVGKGLMAALSFLYPNKPIDLGPRVHPLPADGNIPFMPGWSWLHTPGHAPGHVSLFRERDRLLIAGDAFVTAKQESFCAVATQKEGVYGPPSYFTPDWAAARASVEELVRLDPAIAATGHGTPLRGEKLQRGLAQLAAHFDSLAIPRHGRYVRRYRLQEASHVR